MTFRAVVLLSLVLLTAQPAAAASTPFAVPEPRPTPGQCSEPVIASNGRRHLAAWIDANQSVHLMRLQQDGTLLDRVAFRIDGSSTLRSVAVASDGVDFLVAYTADWNSTVRRTFLARVNSEGDVALLKATVDAGPAEIPSLTWGGTAYVLTSADGRATVITREGAIVRTGVPVAADARSLELVEFDGALLATWVHTGDDRVHGAIVTAGMLAGPGYTTIAHAPQAPTVPAFGPRAACHSGGCLVAWSEPSAAAGSANVIVRTLTAQGNAGSTPTVVGRTTPGGRLAVAWDGNAYTVAWNDDGARAARVDANGVAGPPVLLGTDLRANAAAGAGGRAIVVSTTTGAPAQVMSRVVDGGGAAGEPALLSRKPPKQRDPVFADCGSEAVYAWVEYSGEARVRYGEGSFPLRSRGVRESTLSQLRPAIACGGAHAIVAWIEKHDLLSPTETSMWTAAIDRLTGTVTATRLGAMATTRNDYESRPAVLWNGSEYVVAWQSASRQLVLTRLAADGRIIDPIPFILQLLPAGVFADANPALAWNGSEYVISWQRQKTYLWGSPYLEQIPRVANTVLVARLSASLHLAGTPMEMPRTPSLEASDTSRPVVAASPEGWLVTWGHGDADTRESKLLALRLRRDFTTGDPSTGRVLVRNPRGFPLVARWDGSAWEIAGTGGITILAAAGSPEPVRESGRPSVGFAPSPNGLLSITESEAPQRLSDLEVVDDTPKRRRPSR